MIRPETADLARRIDAAAIRNGTDPEAIHAMARRIIIYEIVNERMDRLRVNLSQLGAAFERVGVAMRFAIGQTERAFRERW